MSQVAPALPAAPDAPTAHVSYAPVHRMPPLSESDSLTERYVLLSRRSVGASAEIYRAHDRHLQRTVALKLLRQADPCYLGRLQREARVQAGLRHPNICRIDGVGFVQGRPCLAMEYIDGEELGVIRHRLSVRKRVEIIRRVASAVDAAHRAGFIHRDLKPANIMVETRDDGCLRPVVVDFGLARAVADDGAGKQPAGTPGYMAPEQAAGRSDDIGPATDVYGLGATLYALVTGQPPFPGLNAADRLLKTLSSHAPSPRLLVPTLPMPLTAIILTCLSRQPEQRYASARALADDLDAFLHGRPVRAHLPARARLQEQAHRLFGPIAARLRESGQAMGLWWESHQSHFKETRSHI
ncbi:MAG: serine/threonine-protein kinase [Acidobacteriota bacterium]